MQAGDESFDLVFLASDAIEKLLAARPRGRRQQGRPDALQRTAVAVRVGTAHPDIDSEDAVRAAVLARPPSAIRRVRAAWRCRSSSRRWASGRREGADGPGAARCARGFAVALGQVALGFQQLSELIDPHVEGIDIVGRAEAIAIDTVFSAAVVAGSPNADAARCSTFMASPDAAEAKRRGDARPAWARRGHHNDSNRRAKTQTPDRLPTCRRCSTNTASPAYQWVVFAPCSSSCCSTASTPRPSATSRPR